MEAVYLADLERHDPRPLRRGGRTRYLCPLSHMCLDKPRDDAHRSLSVENLSGVFYCHRCGEKGKLREFWEERGQSKPLIKRTQLRPVAALIARAVSRAAAGVPPPENKIDLEALREKMEKFTQEFSASPGQKYLRRRGIPRKISLRAGCGYAAHWKHWEKKNDEWNLLGTDERVVFPVCDEEKDLVAIHSRAIGESHLHSAKITRGNKSKGVFLSSPDVFSSPVVAICEGPVDALALETCGIPAVAMIGTGAPKWLAMKLKNKAVLLATDADKAGDEAAMKLEMALRPHTRNILRLRPLHAKDWAEELEMLGQKKVCETLVPFARETDDVTRANSSWQFVLDGDHRAGEFVARLIDDTELRNAFLVLIRKEHLMAA
jgi:DNA primase